MFTTPSTDYITATKLIESFSSFFGKINSISTDSALNAQKLNDIKKILYSNIHSQQNILNATHDLCTRRPEELRSTPRPITIYSPRPEQSQKIETSEFSVPQNYFSVPGTEQRQIANQEGYSEEKTHLNTEYLPATSFLALVRAACHNDMSKLFSLSLNYAYIRTFSDNREPVFTALCFAFLEKIARQKGKDSQFYLTQGYHQRKFRETGSNSARETEFLDFFKIFCQTNSNESDISKRFYESVMGNPGFYQSALSIFKHHIKRVVSGRPQDLGSGDEESFEWMNDLDEIEDVSYFQALTQVFKKSIKLLILTRTRLVEKAFYYENYGYSMPQSDANSKNELTIFFDKVSRTSFILYPNDKPVEEDLDVSFSQRNRVKANTATPNINVKPPLNNDLLKSQKSFGLEQANGNGSLSTLDTASGNTLTSLNELENKDRQKTGPASRPQVLKKAGTLNVVTSSLNECGSPSFTYPESAQIRPNTEKVYYMGFHSASKDLGLYRLKTEEDVLMRKDREPTPSRPSTTHRHFESPGFGDRTFTEVSGRLDFSRQALNTLGDEYKESRDVSFLEKSPIKECVNLRAYMSETKDKSDHFYGRGAAVEMYSQRNSHVRGYEAPMVNVVKPMALPILLKNKIDKFNQSVNQNDQELVGTVGKYLKSEGRSGERSQGLRDIMGMYQMIVDRTEDNSRRSNFGVMMRMDV